MERPIEAAVWLERPSRGGALPGDERSGIGLELVPSRELPALAAATNVSSSGPRQIPPSGNGENRKARDVRASAVLS